MGRSRPPAVDQIDGVLAPFFRHVAVIHRGVDKRLKPLLTAGAGEVVGGALFCHTLSTLFGGHKILFFGECSSIHAARRARSMVATPPTQRASFSFSW
jgi:hypothetical protein